MCHCITPAAFVSALVNKARDGTPPSEDDLRAVLGSGCDREAMRTRFESLPKELGAPLLALLDRVTASSPGA